MNHTIRLFIIAVVVLLFGSLAFAQTDIGFKGVGAKLGFVSIESGIGSTVAFGALADLGTITHDIHLGAFFDFWSKSYSAGTGYGYNADWTYSEFTFGGLAKYYFKLENSSFKPYAGAGLDLAIGKVKWNAGTVHGDFSSSKTDLGFDIFGGADYPFSPNVTGFAQVGYHIDGANYFGIFAGVVYSLGK